MIVSATFEFLGVQVECEGTFEAGYRTYYDFMPSEVYVESARVGDQDVTLWLDYFPDFLQACEEALERGEQ